MVVGPRDGGSREAVARNRPHFIAALALVVLASVACSATSDDLSGADATPPDSDPASAAEIITLTVSSPVPENILPGESLAWWTEELEKRTDGRVKTEVFHAGALLPGTETMPGTADGRTDVGLTYSVYHTGEMPLLNLANLPFVTSDNVAVMNTFYDLYEVNPAFRQEFAGLGVRPLLFVPNGSAAMGYTEAVESLDALQGKRFRATGYIADVVEQIGVDSTFVEFTELYESLERGVVDGWAGTEMTGPVAVGLPEVTPYFIDSGIGAFAAIVVMMNDDVWASLPPDIQQTLDEIGQDYREWVVSEFLEYESRYCAELQEADGSVILLAEVERDAFEQAVGDTVLNGLRDAAVARGVDQEAFEQLHQDYLEGVARYEGASEYTDGLRNCAQKDG